ncbi:MAG: hypothetical protein JWR23_2176, partial [Mucilaginibacter sp.]|nr:hypothetical protein [Mucilaginibacter sp.]
MTHQFFLHKNGPQILYKDLHFPAIFQSFFYLRSSFVLRHSSIA